MKNITKNRTDEHLEFQTKAEAWIAKHFKHIFIASVSLVVFSLLYIMYTTSKYTSIMDKEMSAINNVTSKVLVVTPDGRVVLLQKSPISNSFTELYLRNVVLNYLLLDGYNFINHNVTQVKDAGSIGRVKQMLHFFEANSQGFRDYYAYLSTLTTYYVNNELPEIIQPILNNGGFEEHFVQQDNYFTYDADIPVITVFNYANHMFQGQGVIHVILKGKINLLKSRPTNPFGIVITSLRVSNYVVKKSLY